MKISFQKHFSPEGTVYDQRISMTLKEFNALKLAFYAEIQQGLPRKSEYIFTSGYETFMKMIVKNKNNLCYMNNTQKKFANIFLKLPLKDRNTYLLINE